MNKKVLCVVGSLREKSFNRTVAEYISKRLEEKGIETSFLDYSKLPFMSQDIEFPAPIEVEKVRNDVKGADALWIVTPEYNGSVSGALKNFLDWISRPVGELLPLIEVGASWEVCAFIGHIYLPSSLGSPYPDIFF